MRQLIGGRLRLLYYVPLAALGIWWYFHAPGRPGSFFPYALGLAQLSMIVFFILFGVCVARGFSVFRVVLLVLPFALCLFFNMKLMALETLSSPTDLSAARLVMFTSFLYALVVLAWIVVFPFPSGWQNAPSEIRIPWKRIEWSAAALGAGGLLVDAWYMAWTISLVEAAQMEQELLAEIRQNAARQIQFEVLYIFLFFLFKVALRVEIAGRYASPLGELKSRQG